MPITKASGSLPSDHPLYAPLLKRRARKGGPDARYFVVPAKDVKAGYRPKTLSIPPAATEAEAAFYCRKWESELAAWRAGLDRRETVFDIAWLVDDYIHSEVGLCKVKEITQRTYRQNCEIIKASIGNQRIDLEKIGDEEIPRFTGVEVCKWHDDWGQPIPVVGEDGKQLKDCNGKPITEASTPSRQRALIVMLRILAKHAVKIGKPNIASAMYFRTLLCDELEFDSPEGRDVFPERQQVQAIVAQARRDGYRSIAITTLAQFELIERRIHIIGYWEGPPKQKRWKPGWEWSNIDWRGPNPTWVIRYYQSKTQLVLREFDLKTVPALLELLQEIPEAERWGPVIIAERKRKTEVRQPWHARHYAEVFREIAQRAGVPDEIWSMDMRAGGGTEADIPEVSDRQLQDSFGHSDPKTKDRYRRKKQRNAQAVVKQRQERFVRGKISAEQ